MEAVAIVALCVALLVFVGFYVYLEPRRFQFREDGMEVLTWRGRQFFPSKNASRAQLWVIRAGLFLQMRFGRWTYVMLRLMEFRKSADLVREIERRLPVAIEGRNSAGARRILGS